MNIPNNFTNFKSEMYRTAIIIELKEDVIEHRVITITPTLEETQNLAKAIAEMHDIILIKEKSMPTRPVGACEFPIVMHYN